MAVRNIFTTPEEDIFLRGDRDNQELLKAWAGTTLAFAIFQVGGNILNSFFLTVLLIAAVTCGIGFVLHELAHRIVARNYGAEAHFVANNGWLLISIAIAFAGFFIAAPGAVWHRGYLTKQQGGLIALAGPATNMALAIVFLLFSFVTPQGFWSVTASIGYSINAWLGLFNMIPAGPFDGAKVLNWSPLIFGITAAVGVGLVFVLPRAISLI